MPQNLVAQLYFARSEFQRAFEGVSEEDAVIRLGEMIACIGVQDFPGTQLVVAADRPQFLRRAAQVFENPPISGRAKSDGAGAECFNPDATSQHFGATHVAQVAVREEQRWQAVHPMSA